MRLRRPWYARSSASGVEHMVTSYTVLFASLEKSHARFVMQNAIEWDYSNCVRKFGFLSTN